MLNTSLRGTKQSQTDPQNLVTIGKILKPRGLSGEVKCQVLTNKPEAFSFVPNIQKISFSGGFAFLKFKDVNTFEAAERLRGKLIEIKRCDLPLDDDEILADDLIGFEVVDQNGKKLGTVRKIQSVGASEVIECHPERSVAQSKDLCQPADMSRDSSTALGMTAFMFPYEDEFVIETNMTTRQIIIRAEMLGEEIVL